jgi:hypothetical protein
MLLLCGWSSVRWLLHFFLNSHGWYVSETSNNGSRDVLAESSYRSCSITSGCTRSQMYPAHGSPESLLII